MLRLTNLADYAVVVMTAAARCDGDCLSAGAVAARTGIPVPTVAKVMGLLKRGGLLASSRGVAGGFRLARAAAAISVADIIEAVEGPIALTNCQHGPDHEPVSACALEGSCAVRPHWRPINLAVRTALAAVTLGDLAAPARAPLRPLVTA
ncbi:MAG: SUF system Fe-S cluster assembly regulator [Sphingomonadaceae bacterium]|nr:SUF system Fe-S cluster assembly regulator [Sphingomonadaceae bacterium]